MRQLPQQVRIVEVGPRDGLQNEATLIPTATKLEFIARLSDAGLRHIEATSFVHPKAVPQVADAEAVSAGLSDEKGEIYSAIVPNLKGLDRAVCAGFKRIAVITAASDTFAKKNIHMTVDESLIEIAKVVEKSRQHGLSVRGYLSTSFVCPFEGEIDKTRVRSVAERLLQIGVDEVAISDTLGAAAPTDIRETVGFLLETVPASKIALHLHDTYGTALANVVAGLELGIITFDSSAGGLGGCPYAPGALGNLATEDLVYLLDRMGIETGVDLVKVVEAGEVVAKTLGRPLSSRQWHRLKNCCRS